MKKNNWIGVAITIGIGLWVNNNNIKKDLVRRNINLKVAPDRYLG
jgi:hypothetical protein